MREIKYKAWDKVNKKWLEIDDFSEHIYFADKGCDKDGVCKVWFGGTREEENIIWVEYTGLKDRNGKEGYHKDVCRHLSGTYSIEWIETDAKFVLIHCGEGILKGNCLDMRYLNTMEIIGNIYPDRELLK